MTTETEVPTQVSNVTLVRDPADGRLHVYVGKERMIGAMGINVQPTNDGVGILTCGLSMTRVRLAENGPVEPVYAKPPEVLSFPTKPTLVPPT